MAYVNCQQMDLNSWFSGRSRESAPCQFSRFHACFCLCLFLCASGSPTAHVHTWSSTNRGIQESFKNTRTFKLFFKNNHVLTFFLAVNHSARFLNLKSCALDRGYFFFFKKLSWFLKNSGDLEFAVAPVQLYRTAVFGKLIICNIHHACESHPQLQHFGTKLIWCTL